MLGDNASKLWGELSTKIQLKNNSSYLPCMHHDTLKEKVIIFLVLLGNNHATN